MSKTSIKSSHVVSGADSGLVKLVVMTNVFFNNQNTKSELNSSYAVNR